MGYDKMMRIFNKKILIIVSLCLLLMIGFIVFRVLTNNKNEEIDSSKTIIYEDSGSGETVIDTPNKTKEKAMGDSFVMLGFTKLLEIGVSYNQLEKIKTHFSDYSMKLEDHFKEISITTSSIKSTFNSDTNERIITFSVIIDRKTSLEAKITYIGLGSPSLYLYDEYGNQIHKSI